MSEIQTVDATFAGQVDNFPVDSERLPVVLAYKNPANIADLVLGRTPSVTSRLFDYFEIDKAQTLTITDSAIGRTSEPNYIEQQGTLKQSSVNPYFLQTVVLQSSINDAGGRGVDPLTRASEFVISMVELDRERRVAEMMYNLNNYLSTQRTSLTGTDKWTDYTNSDPVGDIKTAIETTFIQANAIVMGKNVWNVLRRHPKIVGACNPNSLNTEGFATIEAFKTLFDLTNVYIGSSRANLIAKGLTPTYSYLWGGHCAVYYQEPMASSINGMPTFGYTVPYLGRRVVTIPDQKMGGYGGYNVVAGESLKELIICPDLGYLMRDVI
jgi:hypothetical protein